MSDSADNKPEEAPQTTEEETPAEGSKTEEPKAEEATSEEPKAEETKPEEPKQEEQPAAAEGDEKKEEAPKSEGATGGEEKKAEKEKEKKKSQPKPKSTKPPVDYKVVHAGWLQKRGNFFKSFKREFVSLEQEGEVIRVYGDEHRAKSASFQLFMSNCIKVVARGEEHAAINWPGNTETEHCFAIHSPNRVLYFVAENADTAKEWIEKVEESREKFGKEGLEPVSEKLFSVAGFKKSIKRAFSSAEQDSQKASGEGEEASKKEEGDKKEEAPKKEGEEQPPAEGATATATQETTTAEVTQEKPKEEEKPADPKPDEPKAEDEAKPEEPKTEEEAKPEETKEEEEETKPAGDEEAKGDEGGD